MRITKRKRALRRTHLKRFWSETVHIHQGPLRSLEEGSFKRQDYTLVPDGKGTKTKHDPEGLYSVKARTVHVNMEGRYDTFALKARNKAAQQVFGDCAYIYNGQLIVDTSRGKMKLPVQRDPVTGKVQLLRTEGANEIPRAAALFKLQQTRDASRQLRIETLHSIVLEQGKYNCVRYFFGGNVHLLIDMSLLRCRIRRSRVYHSRELCLASWETGYVDWEPEEQELKPSE